MVAVSSVTLFSVKFMMCHVTTNDTSSIPLRPGFKAAERGRSVGMGEVRSVGTGEVRSVGTGEVRVGTASWTDRTLIESGWYPPEANNPEKRLRYYARQFPLVEVDATYYALPAEQTARAWAERTPPGFTFNIKAFSLFTQHPTRIAALPKDLRPLAEKSANGKANVYLKDADPE